MPVLESGLKSIISLRQFLFKAYSYYMGLCDNMNGVSLALESSFTRPNQITAVIPNVISTPGTGLSILFETIQIRA